MKEKIFFRADGGATTGLGHLVRSIALAEMIKEKYKIDFYCKEAPESIEQKIKDSGFGFIRIADEEEFFARAKAIIVILDGYGFKSDYQKKLKEQMCTVVCIDDLHEGEFFADLIINHAPGITPQHYKAQSYTKFALGLEYALLRPAFLEAAKLDREEKNIENVFICFGGADPENLTLKTLESVERFDKFKKINVVTGASYLHNNSLKKLIDNRINLYSDLDEKEMCRIMLQSDLAIVPSSSVLLEAIACGLKIITCFYVDNQKDFHDGMVELGITSIGKYNEDYKVKLAELIINRSVLSYENLRKNFVEVGERLIFKLNHYEKI